MLKEVRLLNTLWILIYCMIITTAFGLQIFENEEPCPLCYLQRIAMISISCCAAFNLLFGVRLYHYSLAIVFSLFGATVAVRQILLHICPGFPQFGVPFWGLSLYTWSFLSFVGSLLGASLLVGFYEEEQTPLVPLSLIEKVAISWLFLIVLGNCISTLIDCGLGSCKG
ncbi:MAG: disulfide bond formation protein B [Chlamydiales bacterium]